MQYIFEKYKLQMVKENNSSYEIETGISNPQDIKNILRDVLELNKECEEVLYLLCLSTKNKVVSMFEVSRGSLNASVAHPREVFKRAMLSNCNSIIIAHNHPSMDCTPSKEDIELSKRLDEGGNLLGIGLLDFVILGSELYSFKENRLL